MDWIASGSVDGPAPCRWGATGRLGGVSRAPFHSLNLSLAVGDDPAAVHVNRERVMSALGATELVGMRADHGAQVALVVPGEGPDALSVDGLVTTEPGLALLAMGADCVPAGIMDPVAGVIGALHCGWRGLVVDIVGATLSVMVEQGALLSRCTAVLGATICGQCYPVPAERADEVAAIDPDSRQTAPDGQPCIDVGGVVTRRLQREGVTVNRVPECTAESGRCFSYRRDRQTGRQGLAVSLAAGVGHG